MYSDAFIYVPEEEQLIRISEGDGCNLTDEDMRDGYVDYVYYDVYSMENFPEEIDGGIVLLVNNISDEFTSMSDPRCIRRVLDMVYDGDPDVEYVLLRGGL